MTRRAAEWRVVTASKCSIHCFNSYLIPSRNRAVIMRRRFLWLHGDRRGGILGRPLFDAVWCHCYELFYSAVMSFNGALAVFTGVRAWACFQKTCPRLSGRVLKARTVLQVQSDCTGGGLFPLCRNGNKHTKRQKSLAEIYYLITAFLTSSSVCSRLAQTHKKTKRQKFGRAEPFY